MIFELNRYEEWVKYDQRLPVKIGYESMFAPMHMDYCDPMANLSLYGQEGKLKSESINCDPQWEKNIYEICM